MENKNLIYLFSLKGQLNVHAGKLIGEISEDERHNNFGAFIVITNSTKSFSLHQVLVSTRISQDFITRKKIGRGRGEGVVSGKDGTTSQANQTF